jgi:hypothetical protein
VIASNWRHPGDIALRRMLDERFEPIDSVDVRSSIGPRSSARGSRLTLHRKR